MAVCPSQIKIESVRNKTSIQFKVKVIFLKNQAWTKDTVSLNTLAHEQLHFDITELNARKIRKSIDNLKAKKVTDFSQYQLTIQKFVSENERMQAEYDKQTNHGGYEDHQAEWREKISNELNSLKSFSSAAKDCE